MTDSRNQKVGGAPAPEVIAERSQRMKDALASGEREPYNNPDGLEEIADILAEVAGMRPDLEWRVRSAVHIIREGQK